MASQHTPSKTPSRRVLGDLTPKAINTPSTPKAYEASEVTRAQSPLKQVTTHTPTNPVGKENLMTPQTNSNSKKRGIEEVDSAESVESVKMLARARDEGLSNTGTPLTSDAVQKHTVDNTPYLTRLHATDNSKENNPIGLTDPGSPTERATPTPSPEPEPLQASQKSNQSFSDLLNYDLCASQKSEHGERVAMPTAAPTSAVAEGKRRSRAEQLRTRLKFGLYKIRTNQVSKRDADIIGPYEARASYSSDAPNASRSTAMASSGESLGAYRVPNITVSSPRRDQGPVFVQANLDPFRPISKLGPAPVHFAIPQGNTPASSRMVPGYVLSSSPPGPHMSNSIAPDQLSSPIRPRNYYQSPSDSRIGMGEHDAERINVREEDPHYRLQRLKQQQYSLARSVGGVKGDAAEGLLQLMQDSR
ncbi:uncharacterized protein ALTATR162_LOCUS10227 [Alternaria atra]|uniref:Uncharacterized protein n=1 Tax=Alternaria atra TaxID=119953 RepID=A0A8J2NAD8_9PLEO|nr:uncharacterized protein ALTATR162_LOCUS10227 [Alternaria atra]CAG5182572.1 unnamed protein product [Alternaria atra]